LPSAAYDHLMALVVLGVIFAAAVFVVPSLSYVNLLYLEQQQLRNIALSALKTVLFDEGYPANWGSMSGTSQFNEANVNRFGLALLSDPSFYVLDLDKVQRLSYNPMGSISYQKVKELLGLSGYDFSIVLRPQFYVEREVTISPPAPTAQTTVSFNVNVTRYGGQPVPNAIVYATIVYTLKGQGNDDFDTKAFNMEKKYTDSLGKSNGDVTITAPSNWEIRSIAVIFKITVADRATMVVSEQSTPNPDDVANINLVGDTIIAKLNESAPGSNDARWITNIMMYNFETSVNLYNHTSAPWGDPDLKKGGNTIWTQNFPGLSSGDPSILIFTFRTVPQGSGRTYVLLIGPYTLWSQGGVIEMKPLASPSSRASASVQRDVLISGMAYIAELRLWRAG